MHFSKLRLIKNSAEHKIKEKNPHMQLSIYFLKCIFKINIRNIFKKKKNPFRYLRIVKILQCRH